MIITQIHVVSSSGQGEDEASAGGENGLTNINEEVPIFLRSVKEGMNSHGKYGIINSVVGS